MIIYSIFFAVCSFFFVLIGLYFLFKIKLINYKIYGLFCLIMAFSSFTNYLIFSNTLHLFPHLYRTTSPLHYLFGPLSYFFVLYTLDPKRSFKKVYYFHFIPFIFNACELLPTFLLNTHDKLAIIYSITDENFMSYSLGILNTQQHIIIKNILYFVYCLFCLKLLMPVLKIKNSLLSSKNKLVLSWLVFETCSKILLILLTLFFIVLNNNCIPYLDHFRNFFYGFEMLISLIYLIFNPKLLLGIKWVPATGKEVLFLETETQRRKKKQDELLLIELAEFMELNQAYKQKITINSVAESLKVSSVKLTRLINEHYCLSFTDFINNYRISSIDDQISEKKHLIYSFEYIAYEAGFHSKNAFYVAFKKLRNTTPKKYYSNGLS